jgi:hypothetical protein
VVVLLALVGFPFLSDGFSPALLAVVVVVVVVVVVFLADFVSSSLAVSLTGFFFFTFLGSVF